MYLNNKDRLLDMIDFQIFKSKKIDNNLIRIKKIFQNKEKPVFPIKAKDLIMKFNLKEGPELGLKLNKIEDIWINNNFKISNKDIEKIVNN